MKHYLLVLFALLTFSGTQAQRPYVGVHVSGIASSSGVTPFGGVQVGGPVIDNMELRLSSLPLVVFNLLQLDLLYTQPLSETLRGYAGGGADLLEFSFFEEGLAFAVHATAGAEADAGSGIGLFAEVQPTLVLNAPDRDVALFFGNAGAATFYGTLALGVNVHF